MQPPQQPRRPTVFVVGSANMDIVFNVERLPRPGETLGNASFAQFPGGKGANQACAAAKLGASVSMVACLGQDTFGDSLSKSLQSAGVDISNVLRVDTPTGCAGIFVTADGQNQIVVAPGANAQLTPDRALAGLATLEPCDFVLLQLESPMQTVDSVLQWAHARGAITILDPAPAQPLPPAIWNHISVLTPNQAEAATLSDSAPDAIRSHSKAIEAARAFVGKGVTTAIVKMGELGAVVVMEKEQFVTPAFPVQPVDTTAAGDVFNGALAAALANNKPWKEAMRFASAAAAISVTRPGAQSSIPELSEVLHFEPSQPAR